MPTAYVGDRLSENLARSPEGFLICRNCVVARTAVRRPQKYRLSEIGISNSDEVVDVFRMPEELFSTRSIASLEGKPVVSPHPPRFLDSSNVQNFQKGHIQNVRRGPDLPDGEIGVIGDLIVTDSALSDQIESGRLRECSLGYDCQWIPLNDEGTAWAQRRFTFNHVAIVATGRAGSSVRIVDSGKELMNNSQKLDEIISVLSSAVERRSSLASEASSIVRSAKHTENLIASGVGPVSFHRALAEANAPYREYCRQQERGEDYSSSLKIEGQRQQAKWYPASDSKRGCRQPVLESEEDWAQKINRMGRELRK